MILFFLFFKKFRERGREGEREKHQCVVASRAPPTGDLAGNPGQGTLETLTGNRISNLLAAAQFTEPHQPGLSCSVLVVLLIS